MAIIGFVLSFFFALLGLIFSIIGLKKAKQLGGSGQGLAVAGLIISILGMLFWIGIILAAILLPDEVSVSALETFDADTSPQAIEVITYDFRSDVGLADLLDDLGELNKFNRSFYYQPASPETCGYYLDSFPVSRESVDPESWTSYNSTVTMGGLLGSHILARDCGQWQQVDSL